MKLEPLPRLGGELPIPVGAQQDLVDDLFELQISSSSSSDEGEGAGTHILTPDEVDQQELGQETDVEGEGSSTDEEGMVDGFPPGFMLQRFTFEADCQTCEGLVQISFLGTADGATLFGALIETNRINPVCPTCVTTYRQQLQAQGQPPATGQGQPPPPAPPPPAPNQQQHGGQ